MVKLSEFGLLEVFGFIFLFLIIIVLFTFAEIVRNWIRISNRTTDIKEREDVLFKLEKVCKHLELRSILRLTDLCDWLDGLGFILIALIIIWVGVRNFILKI
jgi:hypothetical protein